MYIYIECGFSTSSSQGTSCLWRRTFKTVAPYAPDALFVVRAQFWPGHNTMPTTQDYHPAYFANLIDIFLMELTGWVSSLMPLIRFLCKWTLESDYSSEIVFLMHFLSFFGKIPQSHCTEGTYTERQEHSDMSLIGAPWDTLRNSGSISAPSEAVVLLSLYMFLTALHCHCHTVRTASHTSLLTFTEIDSL